MSSNPVHGKVYSIQQYVIKFVNDLQQIGGFLHQYNWMPRYNCNIVESDIKHHKPIVVWFENHCLWLDNKVYPAHPVDPCWGKNLYFNFLVMRFYHALVFTVALHDPTTINYQKKIYIFWSVIILYSKHLSSRCNLTAQIENAQDKKWLNSQLWWWSALIVSVNPTTMTIMAMTATSSESCDSMHQFKENIF